MRSATPSKLERVTFKTSRLLDFCSEKELVAQTGHVVPDWPIVVLKELVDNALDACEEVEVPPQIEVVVDEGGIMVGDNGPGIPATTVKDILDYAARVSSREAYMAPDRGAQGNALKTIVAMPFVLDGGEGKVVISAHGVDSIITFGVDRIRQEPRIDLDTQSSFVRIGTSVRVGWPDSASSILQDRCQRFLQLTDDYTWLNPHLDLTVAWFGDCHHIPATDPTWRKWKPSDPTCPHWYDVDSLERLITAYIAHDMDTGRERLVREFVSEFRGLSGSLKQRVVLEQTGLARARLGSLVADGEVDRGMVARLLAAMQGQTRRVRPQLLGVIGKEHLRARFSGAGCDPDSFRYRCTLSEDPLPEVYEFAFGYCLGRDSRRLVNGVNWSPGIMNPFRRLRDYQSMDGLLAELQAGPEEPIIIFLHVASPVVRYTDRGKSAVEVR